MEGCREIAGITRRKGGGGVPMEGHGGSKMERVYRGEGGESKREGGMWVVPM